MKREEKLWDETLGGLEEKYINETAERLAENDIFAAWGLRPDDLKKEKQKV